MGFNDGRSTGLKGPRKQAVLLRSLPDCAYELQLPVKSITSSASFRCDFQLELNRQRGAQAPD
jgi:hypothetical protein